ncbi:MAG: type I-E CRISPR-associated endonuclease Cas1e [Candidatus Caldarchaeum sp.]
MEPIKTVPDDEVPKRAFPKLYDRWHFLYAEHAIVERDEDALLILSEEQEETPIPVAQLALLSLGPGTSITDQAVKLLAKNKTLIVWVGEHGVRMYAGGTPLATSSARLLKQAYCATHEPQKTQIARKLYTFRFPNEETTNLSIPNIRAKEAVRMKNIYEHFSKKFNVPWLRRDTDQDEWNDTDPINRALSSAFACLYGITHASIHAIGLSPALGFIHTGTQESFVFDIADLYKTQIAVPIAFEETAKGEKDIERRVRKRMRNAFYQQNLLAKTINLLIELFPISDEEGIPSPEDE